MLQFISQHVNHMIGQPGPWIVKCPTVINLGYLPGLEYQNQFPVCAASIYPKIPKITASKPHTLIQGTAYIFIFKNIIKLEHEAALCYLSRLEAGSLIYLLNYRVDPTDLFWGFFFC